MQKKMKDNFFLLKVHFFVKNVCHFKESVYFCSDLRKRDMKSLFNAYYYFYFYFSNE